MNNYFKNCLHFVCGCLVGVVIFQGYLAYERQEPVEDRKSIDYTKKQYDQYFKSFKTDAERIDARKQLLDSMNKTRQMDI